MKYFVAALLASFTLEAIGVGFHEHVHHRVEHFYSFREVWDGFLAVRMSQFVVAVYLVITLLRFLGSMFSANPLFVAPPSSRELDGGLRVTIAILDTFLIFLALTLLFTASLSAQDTGASIETAVWLIFTILADTLLCWFWVGVLSTEGVYSRIGFDTQRARLGRRFNLKWLLFGYAEILIWILFILIEQRRAAARLDFSLLFSALFLLVLIDFITTKDFWRRLVSGSINKVRTST